MAASPHALRVKNLPGVLSAEAVAALLAHHGAADVKLLRAGSRRAPQAAVAAFPSRAARDAARVRLDALQLAGHRVRADPVESASGADAPPPPLPPGPPPPPSAPVPPPSAPVPPPLAAAHLPFAPAPLAPHLGLHFAPSPLLEYKYPKASEAVVRNIANALMALPKFYTQVLHLMNKMNLPPPFEEDAIPGVFSRDREATQRQRQGGHLSLKRKFPGAQPSAFTVEEDDDDDDECAQDGTVKPADPSFDASSSTDFVKKQRVHTEPPETAVPTAAQPPAQRHVSLIAALHPSKPKPLSTKIARAFESSGLGGVDRSRAARPGVISEQELERQRLPVTALAQSALMRDYERGAASRTLRVRNLAESTDEHDLRFIFGFVLPLSVELSALTVEIAGRSASVRFPSVALATAALDKVHGVAFEGLPLIVSYGTDLDADGAVDSESETRLSTFSLAELDARRLDPSALASERFMRNYERGESSATLYVKNLAKDVVVRDLIAVFGAVVPDDASLSEVKIRHFTEGRMKCQAFVEFPTAELAARALDASHGVVLKEKPLIVCFRKPPTVVAATAEAPTPPAPAGRS